MSTISSTQPQILFADSDDAFRERIRAFFKKAGWSFDIVGDGKSAVQAVTERKYDVIITDYEMPGISGLTLLKNLREQRPTQAIIVLTSRFQFEDAIEIMRQGAVDCLSKPCNFKELRQSVNRVIEGSREQHITNNLFRFVGTQTTTYEFTSKQLTNPKIPLTILDNLYDAGIIDRRTHLKMLLAFQEALTNSLEHGNLELKSEWKMDFNDQGMDKFTLLKKSRLDDPVYANRKIYLGTSYHNGLLTIAIRDDGKGFIVGSLKLKRDAPVSLEFHGRGTKIMTAIMDEVTFTDNGRQIVLRKKLNNGEDK